MGFWARVGLVVAIAGMTAVGVRAQTVAPEPGFEVATIRPSAPDEPHARALGWEGRHFTAHYTTMSQMVQFAYDLQAKQIVNAPGWLDTATWDIEAQAASGEPTAAEFRGMMQRLLAERLGLKVHWEPRTMQAYELVVAKGGAKFQATGLTAAKAEDRGKSEIAQGVRIQRGPHLWMRVLGAGGTMPELAAELQRVEFDRPVVDHTGIKGTFDFEVTATSNKPFFIGEVPDTSDAAPPSIFTALQESLGLKLEPVKTAVQCLVVDTVERPSAN